MLFIKNKYLGSLIIVTLCILILTFVFNAKPRKTLFVRNAVNSVLVPTQKLFVCITYKFNRFCLYFVSSGMLLDENDRLNCRIDELISEKVELERIKAENNILMDILSIRKNAPELSTINAEIISKEPSNWYNVFTIDKGNRDGVKRKQAVINSNKAVVGYISEVGFNWSKVTAIIDAESSVGATVIESREVGIIEGDVGHGKSGRCKLTHISKNADIDVGNYVQTSGLGGIYPKGLLIGVIEAINPDVHSVSKYAIVSPSVNFDRLTQVFIITSDGN